MTTTTTTLQKAKRETMNMKLNSLAEYKILKHWRLHEPALVEDLLHKQMLKKALEQRANDLVDLQIQLEKTHRMSPAESALEAWNQLMKSSTPDEEEPARYAEMDM